jgi:hypothetical protein
MHVLSKAPFKRFFELIITSLPSRVPDLEALPGSDALCLKTTKSRKGIYCTLSHKIETLKTTLSTIEDRKSGIYFNSLPETFKHAVEIARKLGFRYLWIDSLCIVQEDKSDWEKESLEMASIYLYSCLTIAATASTDSKSRIFRERPQRPCICIPYDCYSQDSLPNSPEKGHMLISEQKTSWDKLAQASLNRRAWVMQERALSRRILDYAEDQLYWECQKETCSENKQISDGKTLHTIIQPLDFFHKEPQLHSNWYGLLSEYTNTALTREENRLPALAGIARFIERVTGDRSVAGLWKSDLHFGLLSISVDSDMKNPKTVRAPSWSWASCEGPIMYEIWNHSHKRIPTMGVDCLKIEYEGRHLISPIKASRLVLSARIHLVRFDDVEGFALPEPLAYSANSQQHAVFKTYVLYSLRALEENIEANGEFPTSIDQIPMPNSLRSFIGWCTFDQGKPQEEHNLFAIQISTTPPDAYARSAYQEGVENVLILQQILDFYYAEGCGIYRRIGMGVSNSSAQSFEGLPKKKILLM